MLPKCFKPTHQTHLIRIGKNQDGGYVIPTKCVEHADTLISFGLYNDWSFEKMFASKNHAKVFCYDHTVTNKFWIETSFLNILRLFWLEASFKDLFVYFSYRKFFDKKNATHFKEKIGPKTLGGRDLKQVFKRHKGKNIFLKIDIEGWEYRIMEDLENLPSNVSGLVIELHDIDLHQERIANFIKKTPLNLVHIHGNNYSFASKANGPLVIEMSFVREDYCTGRLKSNISYPTSGLDYPNNPEKQDIKLSFK